MKRYKLVIFDLDGTLLDTIEGIGMAMNKVLEKHSFPQYKIEKYYEMVGSGLKSLAKKALPSDISEESLENYYQELLVFYEIYYGRGIKLYPGIAELLDFLSKQDYILAINSNKIDFMVKKIQEEYFGKWDWKTVIGARQGIPLKPSPRGVEEILQCAGVTKEETVYIGDSEVDLQTAHNAGIDVILVPWGFRHGKVQGFENYISVNGIEQLKKFF